MGPHHLQKILGKNHQSTTKVTLNEPPMTLTQLSIQMSTSYATNKSDWKHIFTRTNYQLSPYVSGQLHIVWVA